MPARNAFDSAFDEVLRVGYLDVDHSIRLLRRRESRLPVPFVFLCHSFSGGLPRDLIRICRMLFIIKRDPSVQPVLGRLARRLVEQDFKLKCAAISMSARELDSSEAVSRLLVRIHGIANASVSCATLRDRASQFIQAARGSGLAAKDISDADKKLAALCAEFGAYLLFSATLLEYFTVAVSEAELRAAKDHRWFDRLSEARQCMGVDPLLSFSLSRSFCELAGLPMPSVS